MDFHISRQFLYNLIYIIIYNYIYYIIFIFIPQYFPVMSQKSGQACKAPLLRYWCDVNHHESARIHDIQNCEATLNKSPNARPNLRHDDFHISSCLELSDSYSGLTLLFESSLPEQVGFIASSEDVDKQQNGQEDINKQGWRPRRRGQQTTTTNNNKQQQTTTNITNNQQPQQPTLNLNCNLHPSIFLCLAACNLHHILSHHLTFTSVHLHEPLLHCSTFRSNHRKLRFPCVSNLDAPL